MTVIQIVVCSISASCPRWDGRHFTVEFLVGERLEHLKRSHLALEADDLIPEEVMQHVYGKEPERQVRHGVGHQESSLFRVLCLGLYDVVLPWRRETNPLWWR